MLSFALVYIGTYDGSEFVREPAFEKSFYTELKPISTTFEDDALRVNGLDRDRLMHEGETAAEAMSRASEWVRQIAAGRRPILVAYPLSFDWIWLYWYFVSFSHSGSPFNHSGCYDLKTAYATKANVPVSWAGRDQLLQHVGSSHKHTHHALDDAREQADLFVSLFAWPERK